MTVIIGQIVYVTVAVYSFYRADNWKIHEAPPWDTSKFFVSMGIVVVSYSSQPYMPAIEGSMKHAKKFNAMSNLTFFAITLVKIIFGLIGYLTFKGDTKQVITNNLPHGPFKIIINICVLMLALFSFTFPAYTVFVLIDKIRVSEAKSWVKNKYEKLKKIQEDTDSEDEILDKTALLTSDDDRTTDDGTDREEDVEEDVPPSRFKRALVRLLLICGALAIAVVVPHFGLYMGFVGNFTGMCLAFIFPCLFHMKLKQHEIKKPQFLLHTFIIIFGSVSAGAGMYYSIKEIMEALLER